jgi:hypothetical protein
VRVREDGIGRQRVEEEEADERLAAKFTDHDLQPFLSCCGR